MVVSFGGVVLVIILFTLIGVVIITLVWRVSRCWVLSGRGLSLIMLCRILVVSPRLFRWGLSLRMRFSF